MLLYTYVNRCLAKIKMKVQIAKKALKMLIIFNSGKWLGS